MNKAESMAKSILHQLGIEECCITYIEELKVVTEALHQVARDQREKDADLGTKWGHDRGMQFGCDGSPERMGARHRGTGSANCPRKEHHHHDERCQSPGDDIQSQPLITEEENNEST